MVAFLLSFILGCRNKTEIPFDSDGDSSGDCVAAAEVCDDVDNDCDGLIDDQDPDLTGAFTWYADGDGDGFGGVDGATLACVAPVGFFSDATDCDDDQPSVNPGADEVCDDLDNDCDDLIDGQDDSLVGAPTWYADSDGDGYGGEPSDDRACEAPVGEVADGTDCDDGDPGVNPDADEICDDRDNDCDGLVDGQDESLVGAPTWYFDDDGDGHGGEPSTEVVCDPPAGTVGVGDDCDDTDGAVNPAATEVCDDVDDDCDGLIDGQDDSLEDAPTWYSDADSDGYGDSATAQLACHAPAGTVSDRADCDDAQFAVNPGAPEVCNDLDDDCDGLTDGRDDSLSGASAWFTDADGDGYGEASSTQSACNQPPGAVADSTDCDDTVAAYNPGEPELCDGIDNDCDGLVDDADAVTDPNTWYADADGDGYGDGSVDINSCLAPSGYVSNSSDCDDSDGTVGRCPGTNAALVMAYTCLDPSTIGDPANAIAEMEAVTLAVNDAGLDLDVYWEDSTGLDPALDLTGYSLVMETGCGYGWQPRGVQTATALAAARDAGVSLLLFGDDAAYTSGVAGVEDLLITGPATDNGYSGSVLIGTDSAAPVSGTWGTATDFSYAFDIDTVAALGDSERVLATRSGSPAWIVREDPLTSQRTALLIVGLDSCDHGVVGSATDLAALGVIFRNTLEWLVP